MPDRTLACRYELKYHITETQAAAIAEFVKPFVQLDRYCKLQPSCDYPIVSLYLDSGDLQLCRESLAGRQNRFKLRIRFYDELPQSPVFFEIKARHTDVILKQRAAVKRNSVQGLLAGHWPKLGDLFADDGDAFGPLQRFSSLQNMLNANGKVLVSYMREAYVTPDDNSVRVTFDRELQTAAYRGVFSMSGMAIRPVRLEGVVLEIKFTDAFPVWLREMVRIFDLERRPFAKYVTCVDALHRFELMMSPSYQEVIE